MKRAFKHHHVESPHAYVNHARIVRIKPGLEGASGGLRHSDMLPLSPFSPSPPGLFTPPLSISFTLRKAFVSVSLFSLSIIIAFVLLRFFYLPFAIDEILTARDAASLVSATLPGSSQDDDQLPSSIQENPALLAKEVTHKIAPGRASDDSRTSASTLDSTPVVYANFKINSTEGGERGHITIDGKTLRYRSNVPLITGRHELQITRTGYALDYVELNGKHLSTNNGRVSIDFVDSTNIQRVVFYMYKLY